MPAWKVRVPILCQRVSRQDILEIEFRLHLRNESKAWKRASFLLDTGSQFTTISIALAQDLAIPFSRTRAVDIHGATGIARGYLSPLWFTLPGLPGLEFKSLCCFSESNRRPLLSLTDLVRHFTVRTLLPSQLHPLGSVLLRLRDDHQGVPVL